MTEAIDRLLTEGLAEGYAGTKKPEKIQRSGFAGMANDYTSSGGGHYHDEWFADDNGGGQELAKEGNEQFTRLYGGGIIPIEELQKLGLTTKDVISRLKTSVGKLKGITRLYETCLLELPDGWNYKYEIIKKSEEVPLTVGYESITFNNREVFAHAYILTPVK